MSIKVMTWVWDHSRAKGSQHHVLLAIADCASDDGSNAFPSIAELMRKTRLSERAVQYALKGLVVLGELFVSSNGGPRGCNRYRVIMTGPVQDQHPAEFAPPPQVLRDTTSDLSQVWAVTPGADPAPRKSSTPQDLRPEAADLAPVTVLEPSEKKISSSKRSSGTRGTRLPDDFEVTNEMREWVREKCPDVRLPEHDRFCDHFRSAPGQRGVKVNWVATWRNWMRTAQERIDERKPRTNGHPPGTDLAERNGAKPSTAVARAAAGLEIANRLRQQREEAERDTR